MGRLERSKQRRTCSVCARGASALDRPRETGGGAARAHIMARACTGAWSCCGALAALCLLCLLCPEACFSQAAHELPAPRRARELSFTHEGRNVSVLERALAQKEARELAAAAAAAAPSVRAPPAVANTPNATAAAARQPPASASLGGAAYSGSDRAPAAARPGIPPRIRCAAAIRTIPAGPHFCADRATDSLTDRARNF